MASKRFITLFVYGVFIMLLHFVAFSIQEDAEKFMMMSKDEIVKERTLMSLKEKVPLKDVPHSVEVLVKRIVLRSRKMAKKANEETTSKIASSSSSSSSEYKVRKRTKKIHHHHYHVDHVERSSTFMALNADYHVPRSHPPKNN